MKSKRGYLKMGDNRKISSINLSDKIVKLLDRYCDDYSIRRSTAGAILVSEALQAHYEAV